MFNPYTPYEAKYLTGFKQKGIKVFVKQTYDRGRNLLEDHSRPAFLLSHYAEMHMAKNHFDALGDDPNKKLLMVDNAEDWQELLWLGSANQGGLVYMAFRLPDAERKARKVLDKKLHAYIDYKLNWRVPGYESVHVNLEFTFGEIYVVLKHGGRFHKVKIEDIETLKGYVL